MSRTFDIMMAGLISGIVALTTTFLGLTGTVYGAVLGAIIYQIISMFIKEPLENTTIRKIENEIIYTLPLILIAILQFIFILAIYHSMHYLYSDFLLYFNQLETITNNNLLRSMGIGLIAMGLYPILQPKNIKKIYGVITLIVGLVLLFRGLLDVNPAIFELYTSLFGQFDLILSIIILLVLLFIIVMIFSESLNLYFKRPSKTENKSKGYDFRDNKNKSNNKAKSIETNNDELPVKDNSLIDDELPIKDNKLNQDDDNDLHVNNKLNDQINHNAKIKDSRTSTMSKNRKFFKKDK